MNIFLDESGKFKDHAVVSFCGVVGTNRTFEKFATCWAHCLRDNGLELLTAKDVLNSRRPLSKKNPAVGTQARISALMPFILCIRKHLEGVRGVSIDTIAFKSLPSHYHKTFGDNPFFTAFLRAVLDAISLVEGNDKLTLICDDEEQMALPMYKLYRRVKIVEPSTRDKLCTICFGDDRFLYGLQAADLIASLLRQESGKAFHGTEYDYGPLFDAIVKQPDSSEHIRYVGFALCDKSKLLAAVDGLGTTGGAANGTV